MPRTSASSVTEVRQPRAVPLLVLAATVLLGVGLGVGLPPLARWLEGFLESSPLPDLGPVGLLAGLPPAWSVPILGGLGVLVGTLLALSTIGEALRLTVAADHLEHRTDDQEGWVERGDVADVFRDGRYLVLLGPGGAPRARLDADTLRTAEVRGAFEAHGWPWRDADPHEHEYERWMDGRPGFAPAEHALLRRRLAERKDAGAVAEVDAELAAHGIVARVRGDRLQARRFAVPAAPVTENARGTHH
ncbi:MULTISPECIES: YqeB family protein [unclassified Isoptericola]|uniref:YqeB family protein n=1 Tax=unclassified Isoptericola TaxID=2623355 RepID=UPI0036573E41